MATHSSVLAWRIPGMGEPGGLPSMGSHRVGHDWSDLAAAGLSFLIGKEIWARWSWLIPILDPSINISHSQEITSNQQLCSHFSSLHLISRMQVKTSTEFSFFFEAAASGSRVQASEMVLCRTKELWAFYQYTLRGMRVLFQAFFLLHCHFHSASSQKGTLVLSTFLSSIQNSPSLDFSLDGRNQLLSWPLASWPLLILSPA